MNNVGDDGILSSIVEQLRTTYQDIDITVVTHNPEQIRRLLGVKTINKRGFYNRILTYRAIRKMDIVLIGGACIIGDFMPKNPIKRLVSGYPGYPLTLIGWAKLLRKPVMVYAIGVENVPSKVMRFMVKHVYNMVEVITLRDEESKQLLEKYEVTKPPMITTADPALSLNVPSQKEINEFFEKQGIWSDENPLMGISFAYTKDRRDELISFIAEIADYLISKMDAKIVFIPMNILPQYDRLGMVKVIEKMKYSIRAKILNTPYTHREIIGLVSRMDLVISSRMHLLIFASLSNVPIVGISRSPKIDSFLKRFRIDVGVSTDDLNFNQFQHFINHVWKNRDSLRRTLEAQRNILCEKSISNVENLSKYIGYAENRLHMSGM